MVSPRYPILMLMPSDQARIGMQALASRLAITGATLLAAGPGGALPVLSAGDAATDAICLVQSFYAMIVRLAERLGIDPDRPRHLKKVTRTR